MPAIEREHHERIRFFHCIIQTASEKVHRPFSVYATEEYENVPKEETFVFREVD